MFAAKLIVLVMGVVYTSLGIWVTIRLGTSFAFAVCSFALASYAIALQSWFAGGMTIAGDVVVLASGMGIVLLAQRIENARAAIGVACLLALAFICKIQGGSLYAGVGLFIVSRSQFSLKSKLRLSAFLVPSGLVVVTLFLLIPNCWENTIEAMRRHPRSLAQAMPIAWASMPHLLPFALTPIGLAVLNWRRFSLSGVWRGYQALPAATAMLICLIPPYAAMQFAAMMKKGGVSYNLDYVVMLATPLVILAAGRCGFDRRIAVLLIAALASGGLTHSTMEIAREYPSGQKLIKESHAYLKRKYPNAKVLYSADQYCFLGGSSLLPVTDVQTVWHFLTAGYRLEKVFEAVESQKYDLLIYPGLMGNSPQFELFDKLLNHHYIPVDDEEIPPYLKGSLYSRRPKRN